MVRKGELHRKLKQWEEAENCYRNSTEIRYTHGEAWLKLAQIKERREKTEEAEEAYHIALELESNHGLAYLGLGRVQSKLDRIINMDQNVDQFKITKNMLEGNDEFCTEYLSAYRKNKL